MKKRIVEVYQYQFVDGEMKKVLIKVGYFHGWGLELNESDTISVSFTIALIEFPDGTVELIHPSLIRFQSPEETV